MQFHRKIRVAWFLTGNGIEHSVLFRAWPLDVGLGFKFGWSFAIEHKRNWLFVPGLMTSRNSWNKCLTRLIFYFSNYRDLRIHFPLSIYSGHFQPFIDFQLIFVLESSNLRILVVLDIPYISLELNVAISQKNSRCTIFDRKRNWTWCPFRAWPLVA